MPHYAMWMVGLIQVGDEVPNLDEALEIKNPGKANVRMAVLFEEVQQGDAGTTDEAGAADEATTGADGDEATSGTAQ